MKIAEGLKVEERIKELTAKIEELKNDNKSLWATRKHLEKANEELEASLKETSKEYEEVVNDNIKKIEELKNDNKSLWATRKHLEKANEELEAELKMAKKTSVTYIGSFSPAEAELIKKSLLFDESAINLIGKKGSRKMVEELLKKVETWK